MDTQGCKFLTGLSFKATELNDLYRKLEIAGVRNFVC